jgi:hypothetical protein
MDRKKILAVIAMVLVLAASIPFPGLYALWGFLALAWLIGRLKADDAQNDATEEA